MLFNGFNLVACGGYGLNDSQTKADLSWGLVHRKHHSQGIGSYLLRFRIENIKKISICKYSFRYKPAYL